MGQVALFGNAGDYEERTAWLNTLSAIASKFPHKENPDGMNPSGGNDGEN
jgi:hypothetical protein